jgi:hypothetical protein
MTSWLAACRTCYPTLALIFITPGARDRWASQHTAQTGHQVVCEDRDKVPSFPV